MTLLTKIKEFLFKRKSTFVMSENLFPVNTIIDDRYLKANSIKLGYDEQVDSKMDVFSKIENFYKKSRDIIVLRHFYCDFAIVIVHPDGFKRIDGNGNLTLFSTNDMTASIFIGKHGQDINHFKRELNEEIHYKYGFYNAVNTIDIKLLKRAK